MSVYLCRWPNGDLSLAFGKNRVQIEEVLDEVGDPSCAELTRVAHPVAVHWHLKERIAPNETVVDCLEFERVDERSISEVCAAYPMLDDVLLTEHATPKEIAAAVDQETHRVEVEKEFSDDPDIADLQRTTGMSKRLAEAHAATAKGIASKKKK